MKGITVVGWLLNVAYLLVCAALAPWIAYRAWFGKKRRGHFVQRCWGAVPSRQGQRPCVWFHAASVGEVHQLAPVLKQLADQYPHWELVISSTTATGMQVARQKYAQYPVFYCPLDFTWAVRRALRRIRPNLLVLVELELWPNLLQMAGRQKIPVAVINARLSENSFRGYRRIGWISRWMMRQLSLVTAQTQSYADRFVQLGLPPQRVMISGSIKFDGVELDRQNARTRHLALVANIQYGDVVWIAGSTQALEEQLVVDCYARLKPIWPELRLIIVPRHPERCGQTVKMLRKARIANVLRSTLTTEHSCPPQAVLVVDSVGELAAWWGIAQLALVGGSFGRRGGQNMIEPAAYGVAVAVGPHTENFRDVVQMLAEEQACAIVHNADQLAEFVDRAVSDVDWSRAMGKRAQNLVVAQQGSVDRSVRAIVRLLSDEERPKQPAQRRAA